VPVEALLLALGAAGLHAFWNLVLAGARDSEAATAVVLVISVTLFAPVAAALWDVDGAAVPFIAASAALELAYFALLAAAYRRSELSLVYPVARGSAPVLVLLGGIVVLGNGTSAGEVAGVALVGAGVLLVRGLRGEPDWPGVVLALAIACCIAGYTLVDSRGVRHAEPLVYLELVLLPVALVYCGGVLAAKGRAPLRRELRLESFLAGAAGFGAYALVLAALRLASAASVAAVRETSVVIAVALAAPVLRERVGPARLAGAALVFGGVAVLSVS
jgi:drug/metabolite transporter (DMT)-like permease